LPDTNMGLGVGQGRGWQFVSGATLRRSRLEDRTIHWKQTQVGGNSTSINKSCFKLASAPTIYSDKLEEILVWKIFL